MRNTISLFNNILLNNMLFSNVFFACCLRCLLPSVLSLFSGVRKSETECAFCIFAAWSYACVYGGLHKNFCARKEFLYILLCFFVSTCSSLLLYFLFCLNCYYYFLLLTFLNYLIFLERFFLSPALHCFIYDLLNL